MHAKKEPYLYFCKTGKENVRQADTTCQKTLQRNDVTKTETLVLLVVFQSHNYTTFVTTLLYYTRQDKKRAAEGTIYSIYYVSYLRSNKWSF